MLTVNNIMRTTVSVRVLLLLSAVIILVCWRLRVHLVLTTTLHRSSTSTDRAQFTTTRLANFIFVNSTAKFVDRIEHLNDVLESVRTSILDRPFVWQFQPNKRERIVINDDTYLNKLSHLAHVTTVALPWLQTSSANSSSWTEQTSKSNVLIQRYYPWTGSEFCKWFADFDTMIALNVLVFRKLTCSRYAPGVMSSGRPSVEFGHMKVNNGRAFTREFYTTPPDLLTFIHVIMGGVMISTDTHVITVNGTFVMDYCLRRHDVATRLDVDAGGTPLYDELFAMVHWPGNDVFHGLVEELPRLAPYVTFLHRNPHVMIHMSSHRRQRHFLRVFGLDESRAVSGPVRARVAYIPRPASSSCMMPRLTETQLAADIARRYIRSHLPLQPRHTVILITRSGQRRFNNTAHVTQLVRTAALKHTFQFAVFDDNPLPTFNDTMSLFHSAVLVVAGTGAGLSNIIFSQPGTYVIEVIPDHLWTPLCFLQLSHVLGHRWHGIPASAPNYVEMIYAPMTELAAVVDNYLTLARNEFLT